ncbi:MAG: L-serine ammonia-lyase, iron-sulfur-dependent, subunit beta [Candidatus Fermentithermobacillus carboniphilus]|uniref:L-serine deaminase n=1 Tax=Candidatus Fermentithermobacillus carboniphilus TaxID=3085328 RepID=A0AAT9LCI5_9FIRM|nr:MAG: L-serine ammonia-lyase, iron-sulfur-dependent, subunit beta [Candidatus Fermentithermobacillus carboniphilus]
MPGLFDVLGPVMIGPSSSHTAGAARLGKLARILLGEPPRAATITLHGSFAATYKGHGTDLALVGGLLGFSTDDERIREAFEHARRQGLGVTIRTGDLGNVHPNTVRFDLVGANGKTLSMAGSSIGGGKVEVFEIEGLPVSISGERPTLVASYPDRPGVIAAITAVLARERINIATMRVTRSGKGKTAIAVLETDQDIPEKVLDEVRAIPGMDDTKVLRPE